MSERYYITGVQIGIIKALAGKDKGAVLKTLKDIEDKQFIGNRSDLNKILKQMGVEVNESER